MKYLSAVLSTFIFLSSAQGAPGDIIIMDSDGTFRSWTDIARTRQISCYLGMENRENEKTRGLFRPIQSDEGERNFYGKSYFTLPAIALPYLQHCYIHRGEGRTIELGAAEGKMVWKALLAGVTVYANELSKAEMMLLHHYVSKRITPKTYSKKLKTIAGNCLNILTSRPDLRGTFDSVYAQNLLHFFSPAQVHQAFDLMSALLKPNGRIYLTANAHPRNDGFAQTYEFIQARKTERVEFPGLIELDHHEVIDPEGDMIESEITRIGRIADGHFLTRSDVNKATLPSGDIDITYTSRTNCFDREIFEQVARENNFDIVRSFYMNFEGQESTEDNAVFVSLIAQKKA